MVSDFVKERISRCQEHTLSLLALFYELYSDSVIIVVTFDYAYIVSVLLFGFRWREYFDSCFHNKSSWRYIAKEGDYMKKKSL